MHAPFEDLLKDADVLQSHLHNPSLSPLAERLWRAKPLGRLLATLVYQASAPQDDIRKRDLL